MTSTNDLSAPLLGNLTQHECDERDAEYDDKDGCISCSLKIGHDDTEESEDSQSSSNDEETCFLSAFTLHVFLFVQFGMAFSTSPVEATTGLSWSVVNYSIILYAIISAIYRQAIKDCKPTCSTVVLLPEILIDIMLLLVLFNKVVAAFLVLLVSILCLAFLVVASGIRVLGLTKYVTGESECDDDLQQPQDELDYEPCKLSKARNTEQAPRMLSQCSTGCLISIDIPY
jgi:hypothetical protein